MPTYTRRFSILIILVCLVGFVNAQKKPLKWGQVSKEELDMTRFELDSSASAVVLGDYAEFKFDFSNGETKYTFNRHKRIKIIDRAGFSEGDIAIPLYQKEKISQLKAHVIAPDGSKQSVSNREMFEEKNNDNWRQQKFTFPNLQEGCIIEYKYQISSEYYFQLPEWYFQYNIPVLWSEYRLEIPEWFDYISMTQGRQMDIKDITSTMGKVTIPDYRAAQGGAVRKQGHGSISARIFHHRYVMKEVPAMKSEAYITTMKDYYAMIKFQLKGVDFPNSAQQSVLSNWVKVAEELDENSNFGKQVQQKKNHKNLLEAISPELKNVTEDKKKVKLIYEYLANNIDWNGYYSMWVEDKLDQCFLTKQANSGELNLMLIAIAKEFGINAQPMLISTRSHGKMIKLYPILSQFNHVLAVISFGEDRFIYDVGDPLRPISYPRINSLNQVGWIASPQNPEWVQIPITGNKETEMYQVSVDETGQLNTKISGRYQGYSTIGKREKINKKDAKSTLKEMMAEKFPESAIKHEEVKNLEDINAPLTISFNCIINGAVQKNGDFIYLSPVLSPDYSENPLKLEDRTFPVDFAHPLDRRYVFVLDIPDGYAVEEWPENISMSLPNRGATYSYSCTVNEKQVQVNSHFKLDQVRFEPEEYLALKNFFNMVIEKQKEQLVLKKKT